MSVHAEKISAYVTSNRQRFVDFLHQLVLIESPSTVPATQELVFARLVEALQGIDYRVDLIPGHKTGGHLLARPRRRNTNGPAQMIVGHTDTVWPIGTLKRMPAIIDGHLMKGPGVFDMKAGLAQLILALEALHALQLEPAVTPIIFINSDEEIGSPESRPHIEEMARTMDRALVLEPALGAEGRLKTERKGVGFFDLLITGKPSHAGLAPEEGISAILELSHVIQKLFAMNDLPNGISVNVGTVEGGLRSNVIAPESRATIDLRVLRMEDGRRLESRILQLAPTIPGTTIEITGGLDRGPLERTPRNQQLWRRARELGQAIGLELGEATSGGASDGNFTSSFTATLDGLGAVGAGAHAFHEFIDIDSSLPRCALLALLLLEPPLQMAGKENMG